VSLRIRLTRVGAKKQASYRIVVAESAAPRDGQAIAILGHYNPLTDPYTLKIDEESAVSWLKKGAQPSETARGLLHKAGVIDAFEKVRKGQPAKRRVTAEEAAAKREARAKRTGEAKLVRPVSTGEGAAVATAAAPAAKTTTRAKAGSKATGKAAAKPRSKKS
jgi:small subunit ribosomal protein S16